MTAQKAMLIINADDWGGNRAATDNMALCFKRGRITSASAMLFMKDSERAAGLGRELALDTGLHLNFTTEFDGSSRSDNLITRQRRIALFLRKSKYHPLCYNPRLTKDFEYVYAAQLDEYVRLYDKLPSHINGHHHMHLSANILLDGLLPEGSRVRRNFSFFRGERSLFNRLYRRLVDAGLSRKHTCTDYFFSISPVTNTERIQRIIALSQSANVELMVHPEKSDEFAYLMTDQYSELIERATKNNYASL